MQPETPAPCSEDVMTGLLRVLTCALLLLAATAACAQTAPAQAWPTRPIKLLIVPTGPGLATESWRGSWPTASRGFVGQQVFVENVRRVRILGGRRGACRARWLYAVFRQCFGAHLEHVPVEIDSYDPTRDFAAVAMWR